MRTLALFLALLLLPLPAGAVAYVPVLEGPFYPVRSKSGAGSIAIGCGVVYTGNSLSGSIEIDAPSVGGQVDAVVVMNATSETVTTKVKLVGTGLVQLRAGANVARGDMVQIADTQGRWGPANSMASNAYYRAVQAATTGTLFWARPGGREGIAIARTASPLTGTGALQNIPHGLGSTPTACVVALVALPLGLNLLATALTVTPGTHDSTNAKFTVTTGVSYHVMCWL